MFGKEVDTNVQEGRINSILGKGCKFKGTIEVEGTLRIDSELDRKSTRLNSSHSRASRMPSSA